MPQRYMYMLLPLYFFTYFVKCAVLFRRISVGGVREFVRGRKMRKNPFDLDSVQFRDSFRFLGGGFRPGSRFSPFRYRLSNEFSLFPRFSGGFGKRARHVERIDRLPDFMGNDRFRTSRLIIAEDQDRRLDSRISEFQRFFQHRHRQPGRAARQKFPWQPAARRARRRLLLRRP